MPKIQFDVLVPDEQAQRVAEIFQTALDKVVASGKATAGKAELVTNPALPEGLEEQLRQTYRDEHDDFDLEFASVYRYVLAVDGLTGSVNQLAMVLGRLLTPHAVLPKDHVLLENETVHEVPAVFPWSVTVLP